MLDLILARHGESYGNLDFDFGPDTDLTERGQEQARLLAQWLYDQGYAFSAIYCSTLERARQTAGRINAHFGLEIVFDPDLREAEIWLPDVIPGRPAPLEADDAPPFDREYEAMVSRVMRATRRILTENSQGQVLVVAHGGTLGTMLRSILGSHALLLYTDLAAVHRLSWDGRRWNLHYANRRQHLSPLPEA